jgi:hypothetical protein
MIRPILTWTQVRGRRLTRSHLVTPAPRDRLVDVVDDACGIQAQVMSAAEWAIGTRVDGLRQPDVRAELWERRSLVKTYGPRGTLHLLPARNLPTWMAALHAVPDYTAMWRELAGLSPEQIAELVEATGKALDGKMLTREELGRAVSERVSPWARERLSSIWGDLLAPAALSGYLCFGPSRGAKTTFVRADQWIGGWRDEDPHRAILTILRRFLAAYGPTIPQEFARWFAIKPALARELFDELGEEIAEVDVEGDQAWLLVGDVHQAPDTTGDVVRLLPQYDCFVIGSRPREQLVRDGVHARLRSYRRGRYEGAAGLSTLLVEGFVTGIWDRRKRGREIEVAVEAIEELTERQQRQLELEVAKFGAFWVTKASLGVGALQ